MIVVGLTGSIAMGKSTAGAMFRRLGIPVHDADRAVHDLLAPHGAAVTAIAATFPECARDGAVDRAALASRVFGDQEALDTLESLLHPLVYRDVATFLATARRQQRPLVVLDVPLLYETGGDAFCDLVAVVSAPRWVQVARLARRPNHDQRRLDAVAARQISDAEKRRRADIVIPTGLGRALTMRCIAALIRALEYGRIELEPLHNAALTIRSTRCRIGACGKLFLIRKRPGSIRMQRIGSSKSGASNF